MRAGVGRADITPPVGIPAGGWGNQLHEISEGNDLELWATVLVVEGADGARAAIADVDLCILDDAQAARARSVVAAAAGLPAERVAAGTTHNHSVPVTLELGGAWIRRNRELVAPYVESVFDAIGRAAADAAASLQPVRVGSAQGSSPLAVNRRMTAPDGRAAVGPQPGRRLRPDADRRPPRRRRRPPRRHDRPLRLPPDRARPRQQVRDARVPGDRQARRRGGSRRPLPLRPGSVRRRRPERAVRAGARDLPAARRHARPRGGRHRVPRRLARAPAARAAGRGLRVDRVVRIRARRRAGRDRRGRGGDRPAAASRRPRRPADVARRGGAVRGRGLCRARRRRAGGGDPRAHRADEVRADAGRARRGAGRARRLPAARAGDPARPGRARRRPRRALLRARDGDPGRLAVSRRRSSPPTGTAIATTSPPTPSGRAEATRSTSRRSGPAPTRSRRRRRAGCWRRCDEPCRSPTCASSRSSSSAPARTGRCSSPTSAPT